MSEEARKSIEEMIDPPEKQRRNWQGFVEGDALNFFTGQDIEKMTIEDGEGNKAKLTRLKDNSVRIETTSSSIF